MRIDSLYEIQPDIKLIHSDGCKEEIYALPVNIYGLHDQWRYNFMGGTLYWISFDKYIDSLTEKNFNLCLDATQKLIKDYTETYGKPDTTIKGNLHFVDPYKKHHWGYQRVRGALEKL